MTTELNNTIEVHETQVQKALVAIRDNMIDMTLSNQVDNKSIILQKDYAKIINFEVKDNLIIPKDQKLVGMVMAIHIEDKKVVLEEELVEKIKFNREYINQRMEKVKRELLMVCFYKSMSFRRAILKSKKNLKF